MASLEDFAKQTLARVQKGTPTKDAAEIVKRALATKGKEWRIFEKKSGTLEEYHINEYDPTKKHPLAFRVYRLGKELVINQLRFR